MLGLNAQAWNTPGGIYDRFAGLMGVLATAPNERRKIELQQANAEEDRALKRQYYDILMANARAKGAGGPSTAEKSLLWRQALEQNPAPADEPLISPTGHPVMRNQRPVLVHAGAENYIPAVDPASSAPAIALPDIQQQLADEAQAKQMSDYQESIGIPWHKPLGISSLEARGVNPYAAAMPGGVMPVQPGAGPVQAQAQPQPIDATKVARYQQFGGPAVQPGDAPALFGNDDNARASILATMNPVDRKAALLALMELGYR